MTISNYFSNMGKRIVTEIEKLDAEYVVSVDKKKLLEYFDSKYCLPLLEKDENRDIEYERGQTAGNIIPLKIIYPLIPKERVSDTAARRPSSYTYGGGITLDYDRENVAFVATTSIGVKHPEGEKQIEAAIERITQHIGRVNSEIEAGNQRLTALASRIFDQTRVKRELELSVLDSWIKKVPIKLARKDSNPSVYELKVKKKILPVIAKKKRREEPSLNREQVESVVSLLRNMGRNFERTPNVYSKLSEEDLRDILLAGLNGVFEGRATGETFSKSGKTDIHLRVSKKDVLISECQNWSGGKNYMGKIAQLFSYLTWREIFGIIITFSRRKNFSEVIEKAKDVTSMHETHIKDSMSVVDEGYIISRHASAGDEIRQIEVHHLIFDLCICSRKSRRYSNGFKPK